MTPKGAGSLNPYVEISRFILATNIKLLWPHTAGQAKLSVGHVLSLLPGRKPHTPF